jgi:hypothetical protein
MSQLDLNARVKGLTDAKSLSRPTINFGTLITLMGVLAAIFMMWIPRISSAFSY